MLDVIVFAFWLITVFVLASAMGKWLKRQRLKHGGYQSWDEEWTT